MTRKKKSRSLKRIHSVKTGNTAKLKREAGSNRQSNKRLKGRRTQSVFEKFLAENPETKAQMVQQESAKAAQDLAAQQQKREQAEQQQAEQEQKPREKNLLDQLESKDFGDIY